MMDHHEYEEKSNMKKTTGVNSLVNPDTKMIEPRKHLPLSKI